MFSVRYIVYYRLSVKYSHILTGNKHGHGQIHIPTFNKNSFSYDPHEDVTYCFLVQEIKGFNEIQLKTISYNI